MNSLKRRMISYFVDYKTGRFKSLNLPLQEEGRFSTGVGCLQEERQVETCQLVFISPILIREISTAQRQLSEVGSQQLSKMTNDNFVDNIENILRNFSQEPRLTFHKDLEEDVVYALNFCYDICVNESRFSEDARMFVEAVLDKIWEKLNIGCWKNIPDYVRETYGYASFLKVILLLRSLIECRNQKVEDLRNVVEVADRGLLLGNSYRQQLSNLASSLCDIICSESYSPSKLKFDLPKTSKDAPRIESKIGTIDSLERPALSTFSEDYFKPQKPLKLTGCVQHWPATSNWCDFEYILKKIGPRLVPVEIGRSYTSFDWSQKLMTVEKFIEDFVLPEKPQKIGYLAQHQLFNQIPELLDDVKIPDYCIFTMENHDEDSVDVNAWFGPANTISDLHYDPKYNFLVQVVGSKRVLLIDPKWNENVYPRDDLLLFNTAMVDPENPDYENFPRFKDVEIMECYLNEGDMLFIPPKWWHHVRSLSISFSVSFWWDS